MEIAFALFVALLVTHLWLRRRAQDRSAVVDPGLARLVHGSDLRRAEGERFLTS